MKKVNSLFYIVGIVCIVIAGYILIDKFIDSNDLEININEDEEILVLNNKLTEIGSPLGWIIIVDGINNQDRNGNYVIDFNTDLFSNYKYRQLFVMEYILSIINDYDNFFVLDINGNVIDDMPTSDFTLAYLDYDEYNSYYKYLFGEDFDNSKAMKGNTKYDNGYVYYDNRRAGSNGVYVSMMQATSVEYKNGVYKGDVSIIYSTRASELVGTIEDAAIIEYIKDMENNIILKSFILKDR